jgi:hypothetical protein
VNPEFRQIKCATETEIRDWSSYDTAIAFCVDADHEWCEEKRTTGKCFRSHFDYRQICAMRGHEVDLQGVLF